MAEVQEYDVQINRFQLPEDGAVEYAQWQHPKESMKEITQTSVDAVRQFVQEGDTIIDIGAHTGDTTVPMALAAGASGLTLALEPNPYVYKVLAKNATLNADRTNIVPLNIAATESDGEYTFHYSDSAYCNGGYLSRIKNQKHGHHYPLHIKGRNLEAILRAEYSSRLDRLSYIKIDTEGYDRDVILSIKSILLEYQPVLVTEVLKKLVREEREALVTTLEEIGYSCFKYETGPSPQGERITKSDVMKWKSFDILALPNVRNVDERRV